MTNNTNDNMNDNMNDNIFNVIDNNSKFHIISSQDIIETKERIKNKSQKRKKKQRKYKKVTSEFFKTPSVKFQQKSKSWQISMSYKILSDKNQNYNRMKNTKMCNKILKSGQCNRKNCTFAHYPEELVDPRCVFEYACRFKLTTCRFKHPEETHDSYHSRLNILKTITPPAEKSQQEENNILSYLLNSFYSLFSNGDDKV